MIEIIGFLAFLVILFLSQDPNLSKQTIQQAIQPFSGTLAVVWLGGFCYKNKCYAEKLKKWDRESFVIHGLWHNVRNQIILSRLNIDYILSNISLFNTLNTYWPAQTKYTKIKHDNWRKQYNNHGINYAGILQFYKPQEFQDEERLQQAYFQAGLKLYNRLNLTKIDLTASANPVKFTSNGDILLTKSQLSQIIHLKKSTFVVNCRKGTNILQQIQVCFHIQSDLGFTLANCKEIKNRKDTSDPLDDDCKGKEIRMVHYKSSADLSQDKVAKFQHQSLQTWKADKGL